MSGDRFAEIERLYHDARTRRPEERAAFLEVACGGDDALRHEVESLLSLETSAEGFLSRPALEEAARANRRAWEPGAWPTIPGYTVRRVLGEGGMGVVYLAEQDKPFRRLVALKLIKPGMDTRQVVARFETERQALALMDHPNIAAVFDAGSTHEGRPYFVMEYVDGVSITDYCDRQRLATRDRLALFVQVCAAVQHAHQKGVIHRDLKPSNVLVTERDGRALPKVIDFGTAKAVAGTWNATATRAGQGMVLGTLEYMSPEQAALSSDIDTATDVYSLGVLLYELLVGRLPFDTDELRAAGYDEIRRVIRESDPPKPSVRVEHRSGKSGAAARARQTDAPGLTRQLRGDLDWITLKALEKDRKRRYATVAAFATDIGRFLDDQPVDARPPSSTYRIGKFTRRNRAAVAAAASLFLWLVTGLVIVGWQYVRAEDARERARIDLNRQLAEAEWRRDRADVLRSFAASATADANIQRVEAERQRLLATQETQRALAALDLADYRNYVITIAAADAEIRASRLSQARERLLSVPAARRGWEWGHLFLRTESSRTLVDVARCPYSELPFATDTLAKDFDGKRISFSYCSRLNAWNTGTLKHSVEVSTPNILVGAAPSGRRVEALMASAPATTPTRETKWNVYVTESLGIPKLIGTVDGRPSCADLSSDGRMLAIGLMPDRRPSDGETDVFEVWDTENSRRISQVRPPKPPSGDSRWWPTGSSSRSRGMNCGVRLSPDTTLLATSGAVVGLWVASTGLPVHADSGQAGLISQAIAFSPTAQQLAIGRRNGLIDILDFSDSKVAIKSLDGADAVRTRAINDREHFQDSISREHDEVRALVFTPDGRAVVSSHANRVIVWDVQSARARKVLGVHQSRVTGLVVHAQFVYSSDADGTVKVESLDGASGVRKLNGSTPGSGPFVLSDDGRMLADGLMSGSLRVWHLDEHSQVVIQPPQRVPVGADLLPLSDNRTLLTGFVRTPGSVMRWDSRTWQSVSLPTMDRQETGCGTDVAQLGAVSPNDRYLAILQGNCVVVRDLDSASTLATFHVDRRGFYESTATRVRFLSDESILVTVGHRQQTQGATVTSKASHSVMRWNWTTRTLSADRLFPLPTFMPSVAASRDGNRIAIEVPGFVTIWDGALANEIGRIPARNLSEMSLNADGSRLAVTAADQTSVLIWDTATSLPLLELTDDDVPTFLAFTSGGRLIAANGFGGLTIWETQRPKCPQCPRTPASEK